MYNILGGVIVFLLNLFIENLLFFQKYFCQHAAYRAAAVGFDDGNINRQDLGMSFDVRNLCHVKASIRRCGHHQKCFAKRIAYLQHIARKIHHL